MKYTILWLLCLLLAGCGVREGPGHTPTPPAQTLVVNNQATPTLMPPPTTTTSPPIHPTATATPAVYPPPRTPLPTATVRFPYVPPPTRTPHTPAAPGRLLFAWDGPPTSDGRAWYPSHMALAPDGTVYVRDLNSLRILRFTPQGQLLGPWLGPGDRPLPVIRPGAIAFAPDGALYVIDEEDKQVKRVNPDGTLHLAWETIGYDLAVGPDGSVYVVERDHIRRFTPKGEYLGELFRKHQPRNGYVGIVDIAVHPNGTVFVIEDSPDRVIRYSPTGEYLGPWSVSRQELDISSTFTIAPDGSVFGVIPYKHRVVRFTAEGSLVEWWDGPAHPTYPLNPNQVAVTADGKVYILDGVNRRVYVYQVRPLGPPIPTLAATLPPTPQPTHTPPPGSQGIPEQVRDFFFIDHQRGWMMGPSYKSNTLRSALATTDDGGVTWRPLPPPSEILWHTDAWNPKSVRRLRFANANAGWAYGPGLFSTQDGGLSWADESREGSIIALEVAEDAVWAIEQDCKGQGGSPIPWCTLTILRASLTDRGWQAVGRQSALRNATVTLRVTRARDAWLAIFNDKIEQNSLITTHNAGESWQDLAHPCPTSQAGVIDTLDSRQVWMLCAGGLGNTGPDYGLFISENGGQSWTFTGSVTALDKRKLIHTPLYGSDTSLEIVTPRRALIPTGMNVILGTQDGGRTWGVETLYEAREPGSGVDRVRFVDTQHGWAAGEDHLLRTTDGGMTWQALELGR